MDNTRRLEILIQDFVKNYPRAHATWTTWKQPLVAVASAHDPLFVRLKELVGCGHLLPEDVLPGAKSVICFFLPFDREIGRSNTVGPGCSDQWAMAYLETNQLIHDLNISLHWAITRMGHRSAVIPATHNFSLETLLSNWSHRHVAFIAGLGTFGLNRMLITEQGCCGRIGSLVTDMVLDPTPRPIHNGCLYYFNSSCLQCVENCPAGALQVNQFNRFKCYDTLLENVEIHKGKGFVDACGKCASHIPCAFINPVERRLRSKLP